MNPNIHSFINIYTPSSIARSPSAGYFHIRKRFPKATREKAFESTAYPYIFSIKPSNACGACTIFIKDQLLHALKGLSFKNFLLFLLIFPKSLP